MFRIISILLLFSINTFAISTTEIIKKHPFHVSTTELNFNTITKSLEITCRIFTDDFEDVLFKNFKGKIDLHQKTKIELMNNLIEKYLKKKLSINNNGKNVAFNFIGFENDHEATNVYLEVNNVKSIKQLKIYNTILYDLFDDQINIVHISNNGKRQSSKLNYPEKNLIFNF